MSTQVQISASIVLFNESSEVLLNTIHCFLSIPLSKKLYLIDNSQHSTENPIMHPDVVYLKTQQNIGFGAGHNYIINKIKEESEYHLILNPDVTFEAMVIPHLISALAQDKNAMLISPAVYYEDGTYQFITRKTPTLVSLIQRRFGFLWGFNSLNEYSNNDLTIPFYPDFVHGCFMLLKTKDFIALKGFDTRYFMYMEDADLCRQIKQLGKSILFYPKQKIIHKHNRGSAKSLKLFFFHISSAVKYFNKWGY